MEAASTFETSENFYQTARRNNPEDCYLHENLTSHYSYTQCTARLEFWLYNVFWIWICAVRMRRKITPFTRSYFPVDFSWRANSALWYTKLFSYILMCLWLYDCCKHCVKSINAEGVFRYYEKSDILWIMSLWPSFIYRGVTFQTLPKHVFDAHIYEYTVLHCACCLVIRVALQGAVARPQTDGLTLYFAFIDKVERNCHFPVGTVIISVSWFYCFYGAIIDSYRENPVALGG
jgi:hypothetical protein